MSEETYKEMKSIIEKYERGENNDDESKPYIIDINIEKIYKYNKNFGDDRLCKCGHTYYRHFDPYEDMEAVGCKYCQCFHFEDVRLAKLNSL
ncbi:hypothetical protein M0Q50_07905 [bacterium]|nr:hypothetical protein [bacterium]